MGEELSGFLFVADISGYTGYLNESELVHAHGTLTDLLQILIDRSGPPMTISKLEGDAVFSYAFAEAFAEGQTFVELVEGTCLAFRRAIDSMVLNNTCHCNACANVTSLDLKFVVHFGSFLTQHFDGREELLGPDVNLVHRLMKNSIQETTGIRAYCLFTEAAHHRLGLEGMGGFVAHRESVPDFGVVDTWIHDVGSTYDPAQPDRQIVLSENETMFVLEGDLPMSPAVVWDYLANPEFRNILIGSEHQEITDRKHGRIGVGTAYQCYHGNQVVPQTILEWEPFTKVVTEDLMPKPWKGSTLAVIHLTDSEHGTHLTRAIGRLNAGRLMHLLGKLGFFNVMRGIQARSFDSFLEAMQSDWRSRPKDTIEQRQVTNESIKEAARIGLALQTEGDSNS